MTDDRTSNFTDEPATQNTGGMTAAQAGQDTSFFGHPKGLATLFFTEMWERFSFYGMRGILILFMTAPIATGGLGFAVPKAAAIYGLYAAFVYLLALPGGWLADKVVGQRNAVLYGGILIAAGQFALVINSVNSFYLGLVLLVLGVGLLKPNVSTMVGELYAEQQGARRDAAFSIFYMGINIGALVAPLVAGYLGEKISWRLGFAAAGVGMLAGLAQYLITGRNLGDAGILKGEREERVRGARQFGLGLLVVFVILAALIGLNNSGAISISIQAVAAAGGYLIFGIMVLYFTYMMVFGGLNGVERKRVVVIFILFIFSAVFWSGFEQAGSSLNLVAERLTSRVAFGWQIPASWFQSVNPIFIVLLAPVFAWLWVALGKREPSSPAKFTAGLFLMAAGFMVLSLATAHASEGHRISPMWLVLTYFLHTSGELSLSPVGLSVVTKLAPRRMVGQMMGIWFMSISLGELIAGLLAGLFTQVAPTILFRNVALYGAIAGLVLAFLIKPIRKLMSGVH
ncbi:MAG: peptide MFS transporter [Gemmatimonadota bacterium]|jgi:POT family proton-dependent oligopeptide transporter